MRPTRLKPATPLITAGLGGSIIASTASNTLALGNVVVLNSAGSNYHFVSTSSNTGVWVPNTGGSGSITVAETDASPSVSSVTQIQFPSDTVTDLGSGVVSIRGIPYGSIGALVYHNTTQTVNNTVVPFNSEKFDTDGFHDTSSNTSRLTIPAGMGGLYVMDYGSNVAALAAGEFFRIRRTIAASATTELISLNEGGTAADESGYVSGQCIYRLEAGDYVELYFTGNRTLGHASAYEAQSHFGIAKLDSGKVGAGIGAAVNKAADLAMSTGAEAALTLDTELFDTDGFHSTVTNNERFTVPAGLGGKYLIGLNARTDANTQAYVVARKNGSTIVLLCNAHWNSTDSFGTIEATSVVDLIPGDYIEYKQKASAATNIKTTGSQAWAWIMRLDSGSGLATFIQTGSTPSTGGGIQYDTTTEHVLVYDGQRNRQIGSNGWATIALPAVFSPTAAFTNSETLAANGGSLAVPVVVTAHMLLQRCVVRNRDTASARSWEWRLFEQYLNNGNSSENTLTHVSGANGSESFTASAVSTRVANATSAPVYLAPGVYWLVIRNTHATNTFALATSAVSTEFTPSNFQTKTLGSALSSTLDFVAATWTKSSSMPATRLEGRVFGETAAY